MNYELFQAVHRHAGHHLFMDGFMVFITEKALIIYAIALLLMWFLGSRIYKKTVLLAALTGFLGLLLNLIISKIYFEPRPFVTHLVDVLIYHTADASFPSDHTTGAFSLAFAVLFRHRKIGLGMLLLAVLTGISRIYVGHHYPIDVMGSIVVGMLVSVFIYKTSSFLEQILQSIIDIYYRVAQFPQKK